MPAGRVEQPRQRLALWVACAGAVLPPACAAFGLWLGWVRQAADYPVANSQAILDRWSGGAMVAAVACAISVCSVVVLVWVRGSGRRHHASLSRSRGVWLTDVAFALAGLGLLVAVLLPAHIRATERARQETCGQNVQRITAALLRYAEDHDGYMPAATWAEATPTGHRQANWLETLGVAGLRCPSRSDPNPTYGYNSTYLRLSAPGSYEVVPAIAAHPDETVLCGDGCVVLFAPSSGLRPQGWFVHSGQMTVGWLDGHVSRRGHEIAADDTLWDRR